MPIKGYDGYKVSNFGKVLSLKKGGPLKLKTAKNGYSVVALCCNGKQKTRMVAHLVAEAFIGPRPLKHDVCHNDGTRANNRVDNLRYDTRAGNMADRVIHGTSNRGSRCGAAKLTPKAVLEMRRLVSMGWSRHLVSVLYGISESHTVRVVTGQAWKWES